MPESTMTEHQLQLACAQFLDACLPADATWNHCPNEGKRSEAAGRRLLAEGMKPGQPDIEVVYRGRSFFIELKAPGKYPDQVQKDRQLLLVRCGCPVLSCCRSVEAMVAFISQHVPLRGRIAA